MVNCISLAALFLLAEGQCSKIFGKVDAIVLSKTRGEAWIQCYNPNTGETMLFGTVKATCIKDIK